MNNDMQTADRILSGAFMPVFAVSLMLTTPAARATLMLLNFPQMNLSG